MLNEMLNAFYNPIEAVEDARRFGDWSSTIIVMAVAAVLLAITPIIALKSFAWEASLIAFVAFFAGVFLGGLFLMIALAILGAKKPGYFESVTSISYSTAPLSLALFAASVLLLIPTLGILLATLVAVTGGIVMAATHIRAIMELTKADLLTALVAPWIVASIGVAMSYLATAWSFISFFATMAMNATG